MSSSGWRQKEDLDQSPQKKNCCSENAARQQVSSKALPPLPVGDGRAGSIVRALRDPHLQECAEGRHDRSSNLNRVLSLWRSNRHDLHRGCSHAVKSFVMRSIILSAI